MEEEINGNINTPEYWDEKFTQLIPMARTWRINKYEFLLNYLPQRKKFSLLDIGCAFGDGLAFIQRHFPKAELFGLDFSLVAIRRAMRNYKDIDFICADINAFEFYRRFHYILLVRTLEHLDNPFGLIDKCLGYANTAVVVNVPNPKYRCDEHIHKFHLDDFTNYITAILCQNTKGQGKAFAIYSKIEEWAGKKRDYVIRRSSK